MNTTPTGDVTLPPMVSVRAARQLAGLTAAELAAEIVRHGGPEISPDHIYSVELGRRSVSMQVWRAWIAALGIANVPHYRGSELAVVGERGGLT